VAGSIGVWKQAARLIVDTATDLNGIIGRSCHVSCHERRIEGKQDNKSLIDKAKQKSEGRENGSTFQIAARNQGVSRKLREIALHGEPVRV
jgi:hypothetical protein